MTAIFDEPTAETPDFARLTADFALPAALAWRVLNQADEQVATAANNLRASGTAEQMALELGDAINRARGLLALLEAGERRWLDALADGDAFGC